METSVADQDDATTVELPGPLGVALGPTADAVTRELVDAAMDGAAQLGIQARVVRPGDGQSDLGALLGIGFQGSFLPVFASPPRCRQIIWVGEALQPSSGTRIGPLSRIARSRAMDYLRFSFRPLKHVPLPGPLAGARASATTEWMRGWNLRQTAIADPAHLPPIVWVDDQASFEPALPILPAIASVQRLGIVRRLVGEGRRLAILVHPSAVVSPTALIEPGCVICPLVVVGAHSHVGEGTILNRGSLVGHHTEIGRYSFLGPGANVAGKVTLGEQVYVGAGGIVRDHIRVGDRAVVGMGAVAIEDVPADLTVVGVPARPLRRSSEKQV